MYQQQRHPLIRKQIARRRRRRFFIWGLRLVIGFLAFTELVAFSFRWLTPPRTSYMLQSGSDVIYQFVSIDHISRYVVAATIAHEDQQLGTRTGAFDVEDFLRRARAYVNDQADPSGSTIPQQLVKNIFLWPSQNWLRKGLEAGLATEFAFTLSAKRELELYLNYAQFGRGIYGICAATWYYFEQPPSRMTEYQAAQLMGVLPLPDFTQRDMVHGGLLVTGPDVVPLSADLINGAANVWVPKQVAGMGGWRAALATVGITDTATDHADTVDEPEGCSTMPDSVTERLTAEGARDH